MINRVVERKTKGVQSAQKSPKKEPKKYKKSLKMPKNRVAVHTYEQGRVQNGRRKRGGLGNFHNNRGGRRT